MRLLYFNRITTCNIYIFVLSVPLSLPGHVLPDLLKEQAHYKHHFISNRILEFFLFFSRRRLSSGRSRSPLVFETLINIYRFIDVVLYLEDKDEGRPRRVRMFIEKLLKKQD